MAVLSGASGCGQTPVDVPVTIYPVMACTGDVGDIASVRFDLVGARDQNVCFEGTMCVPLMVSPPPTLIEDVQAALPKRMLFDVQADRGYQVAAIGFSTTDCSYGEDLTRIRFCGRSAAVNFSAAGGHDLSIGVSCGEEAIRCAGVDAGLLFCR